MTNAAQDPAIRRMRWFDIAAVAELDAQVFGPDAWSEAYFWAELAAPGRHFVIIDSPAAVSSNVEVPAADLPEADTARTGPLGFAGLSVSGPQADILTIAAHPAARRQGIGRRLLTHLIDTARAHDVEALHLDVRSDNTAALTLYRSYGFAELDRRRGYYTGADAVLMRRLEKPSELLG